jgi:hypothetical protein
MKILGIFCLLLACIGLESCKKDQSEKVVEAAQAEAEKIVSVECYTALYENDTVNLKINTLKSGEITGDMVMKIIDMPEKVGEIEGEFHGDTLFTSYTFIQGGYEKKTYKNPMAFLKKGDELILGNGEIMTTMGATHFVKGTTIDFDSVKYKFAKVDCVD